MGHGPFTCGHSFGVLNPVAQDPTSLWLLESCVVFFSIRGSGPSTPGIYNIFYIINIIDMLSNIMLCSVDLIIILTRVELNNMFNSLTFLTLSVGNIGFEF